MDAGDLRDLPLFAGVSDAQLEELIAGSTEVPIVPGADMFHEGEPADFWWVLVDGSVSLSRKVGREDVVVRQMAVPGQWAGGFRAWDEQGVYLATGRGAEPGRMLRVPAIALKDRAIASAIGMRTR